MMSVWTSILCTLAKRFGCEFYVFKCRLSHLRAIQSGFFIEYKSDESSSLPSFVESGLDADHSTGVSGMRSLVRAEQNPVL